MIIPNGTICLQRTTGGGRDIHGFPVPPSTAWGEPIRCHYTVNRRNEVGIASEGSAFTIAAYRILIDDQPFIGTFIQLKDIHGKVLCEKSVQHAERRESLGTLEITI